MPALEGWHKGAWHVPALLLLVQPLLQLLLTILLLL
jgi:hypothetical protein